MSGIKYCSGRKYSDYEMLIFYQAATGNGMVEVENISQLEDDYLTGQSKDPELMLIRKELVEKLSTEVQEMLEVVMSEVIITSGYKLPSKNLLNKFLKKQGWSKEKIHRTATQVKAFIRNFY